MTGAVEPRTINRPDSMTLRTPVGVRGDGARSGYKYMAEGDIRYDRVLLDMVAEVAAKYDQDWSRFAVFGFSGGGHFAHRMAILHPDRLWAACIGAAGSVTLLDPDRDWWVGIRDLEQRFVALLRGQPLDETEAEFKGQERYGDFKRVVADEVAAFLRAFQEKLANVRDEDVLASFERSEKLANEQANATLLKVQQAVGLRSKGA